jgi:hypothetical protein
VPSGHSSIRNTAEAYLNHHPDECRHPDELHAPAGPLTAPALAREDGPGRR